MTFTTMGDILDDLMSINNPQIINVENDGGNENESSLMMEELINSVKSEGITNNITVENNDPVRDSIEMLWLIPLMSWKRL